MPSLELQRLTLIKQAEAEWKMKNASQPNRIGKITGELSVPRHTWVLHGETESPT